MRKVEVEGEGVRKRERKPYVGVRFFSHTGRCVCLCVKKEGLLNRRMTTVDDGSRYFHGLGPFISFSLLLFFGPLESSNPRALKISLF